MTSPGRLLPVVLDNGLGSRCSGVGVIAELASGAPLAEQVPALVELDLEVLEAMYVQASTHNDVVVACAVTYFRATALRDAHHHEFLGEWIGPRASRETSHARSSVAC